MYIKILIITLAIIGLAVVGLAIGILVKPNGQFPETHVERNKEMRKLGIKCAMKTDIGCNNGIKHPECDSCSLKIKDSRQ